ncbi:hypothetical protein [Streptomyces sp. YIM S03343]
MTDRIPLDNLNSDQLDALYDRLDRARDAAALHRKGLITAAELYAAIEAEPEPDGTGLYEKITAMFGGPLPWPPPATPICGAPGPWGDAHACIKPAEHPDAHRAHDGCGWHDEPAPVPAATEATNPAMITDPAYLHHLYAQAIRNTAARYPDDIATAVLAVRDRHVEQLQQRLRLADAQLAGLTDTTTLEDQ